MQVYKIGRNPNCDIVFADQSVSGSHADLCILDNGSIQLVEHSTNGTYVNQTYVHQQTVTLNGSEILSFPGGGTVALPQLLGSQAKDPRGTVVIGPAQAQQMNNMPMPMPAPMPAPMPQVQQPGQQQANIQINISGDAAGQHGSHSSQMHNGAEPLCLHSWSWGGFFFGWLWAVFNGIYWPLVCLIPGLGIIAAFVINIVLGVKGNEYAWAKATISPEAFDKKQHNWAVAAAIVFCASLLISILSWIFVFAVFASM